MIGRPNKPDAEIEIAAAICVAAQWFKLAVENHKRLADAVYLNDGLAVFVERDCRVEPAIEVDDIATPQFTGMCG